MADYNTEQFEKDCKALGVTLSDEQIQQFLKYYEMLVEWNEVMNLTAITEYDEVMKKHFVDSISLCKAYDVTQNKTVIDVGTGAGFPGLALKIAFPDLQVTLLDSLNKRIKFLNEVAKIVAKVENSMEREVYVDKISLEYKVSKDAIYAEINKLLYANSRTEQKLEKKVVPVKSVSIQQDEQPVDVKTKRLESLVIYLLINYPDKSFERLKKLIDNNVIKIERNKAIINKLYEEHEKGNINIESIIDLFEDENIVNYLSGIMSSNFEITDVDKCIDDVILTYKKEILLKKRNDIMNKLNSQNTITKDEVANLEEELNSVIIQLAKIK